MAVLVVAEDQVDTQMGMMPILEATQPQGQEIETILQHIPTGMIILGLKLQSKLSSHDVPCYFQSLGWQCSYQSHMMRIG